MTSAASRHVAIWIDAERAVLEFLEREPPGGLAQPGSDSGWARQIVVERQDPISGQLYEAVLSHLGPQDLVWILGPGRAKHELRRRIERSDGQRGSLSGFGEAPTLARVELVLPTLEAKDGLKVGLSRA